MRQLLKRIIFCVSYLFLLPCIIASWLEKNYLSCEHIFYFFGQILSYIPGKFGSIYRAAYYFGTLEKCSWKIGINILTFFAHRKATVGENVSIGAFSIFGWVAIGDNVSIASRVSITSGKRNHLDRKGNYTDENILTKISIGSGTWIGESVVIMEDVGKNCIISAGSVVTKKCPDNSLAVGNPARFFKRDAIKNLTIKNN